MFGRIVFIWILIAMPAAYATEGLALLESVTSTVQQIATSSDKISPERREVLDEAARFLADRLANRGEVALTFICTHNSRRSHLSQVWAQVAAEYYGLTNVHTYSGGVEATACNIRTVRALRRAGLQVVATDVCENPRYLVQFADNRPPIEVFSKIYDAETNPQEGFAAMMCCADVDERCPIVKGSVVRIPLHYSDPKVADDTPQETATYDERNMQIGGEMFYLFARAAKQLASR